MREIRRNRMKTAFVLMLLIVLHFTWSILV
jgi:hypothetical protein